LNPPWVGNWVDFGVISLFTSENRAKWYINIEIAKKSNHDYRVIEYGLPRGVYTKIKSANIVWF